MRANNNLSVVAAPREILLENYSNLLGVDFY